MKGIILQAKQRALWLALLAPLFLFACGQNVSDTVVVTQVVRVAGEDVVVTRAVRRGAQVPVTVTPPSSHSVDPHVLDISMSGRLDLAGEAGGLDPQRAAAKNEVDLIENLFVGLTRYNHATSEVEPQLATDWDVTEGGRVWTFHLRDDIFWMRSALAESSSLLPGPREPQVYRPVVAGDVVYAIRRACDPRIETPDALALFIIEGC
ncbi:MAG TPA: ABC transporter substrate-binding protein, partial [Candidatus Binatia bacterium]|nr:ABC transporter substrate-binding protein [Candidatus Binatia bacterium]